MSVAGQLDSESIHNIPSQEPTERAWLHHDIGRCQLELGEFGRALVSARLCLRFAGTRDAATKWRLRGGLLKGHSLLRVGRLAEAVSALKSAAQLAEQAGDEDTREQARDTLEQVTRALRIAHERKQCQDAATVAMRRSIVESVRRSVGEPEQEYFVRGDPTEISTVHDRHCSPDGIAKLRDETVLSVVSEGRRPEAQSERAVDDSDSEEDAKLSSILQRARAIAQSYSVPRATNYLELDDRRLRHGYDVDRGATGEVS